VKLAGTLRSVDNAGGKGFDAQTADGCERFPTQGLRGEVDSELREGKSVDTLAAGGESQKSEFVGGSARGSKDDDFGRTRACREKSGGAGQKLDVRTGANDGARYHEQL